MRIALTALCVFLIGVEAVSGRQGSGAPARGQAAALAQAGGSVEGLVTVHATSLSGDFMTIATTQLGPVPAIQLGIGPGTVFFIAPIDGPTTKMSYKEVQSGELKRFTWLAASPVLLGKSVKASFSKGFANEVSLYPSCTRERCLSSSCNRKCKASSCVCPQEKTQ